MTICAAVYLSVIAALWHRSGAMLECSNIPLRCNSHRHDNEEARAILLVLANCRFCLVKGVVRGAHQWAGLDVLETHAFAEHLVFSEFVWMNVANDG